MTSREIYELTIIAFIVIGIGVLIWRGGARNPVSTGKLNVKLTAIVGEVGSIKVKVGEIEGRVAEIEENAVTIADIERLEGYIAKVSESLPDLESRQRALGDKISDHASKSAATGAKVEHINRQVDLIYQTLVTKGMSK